MWKTLLVAVNETDNSERAIPVAVSFARRWMLPIELVTIESVNTDGFATSCYHERLKKDVPDDIEVTSSIVRSDDDPAVSLARLCDAREDALLCMATAARTPLGELFVGSVGDELVRRAYRSVLLVGPRCAVDPPVSTAATSILAALDGSDLDDETVAVALDCAAASSAALVLAHVTTDVIDTDVSHTALVDAVRRADVRGVPTTTRLVHHDDPAHAILQLIDGNTALVVVGSHRRGPLARLNHGHNALRLLHHAPCPVLIAGPPR